MHKVISRVKEGVSNHNKPSNKASPDQVHLTYRDLMKYHSSGVEKFPDLMH